MDFFMVSDCLRQRFLVHLIPTDPKEPIPSFLDLYLPNKFVRSPDMIPLRNSPLRSAIALCVPQQPFAFRNSLGCTTLILLLSDLGSFDGFLKVFWSFPASLCSQMVKNYSRMTFKPRGVQEYLQSSRKIQTDRFWSNATVENCPKLLYTNPRKHHPRISFVHLHLSAVPYFQKECLATEKAQVRRVSIPFITSKST